MYIYIYTYTYTERPKISVHTSTAQNIFLNNLLVIQILHTEKGAAAAYVELEQVFEVPIISLQTLLSLAG
jgi:hypothetical protein